MPQIPEVVANGAGSTLHYIQNGSGTRLGLTHIAGVLQGAKRAATDPIISNEADRPIVLLAHGTFSNYRSCQGLARYLAKFEFDCWILDFQGHGNSDRPAIDPTFESMCLEDTAAALSFLHDRYPGRRVHCVGHSGGGLAILMYLARNPHRQELIGCVVTLASQATHAATRTRNRLAIRAAGVVTRILGFAPGKWLGIGPEHEFGPVMSQWYDWSLNGKWTGSDGFDYEAGLARVTRPLMTLAAEADTFIAPQEGCRHLSTLCGSDIKEFHVCGLSSGYQEDYTHARLVSSSSAAKELWPAIHQWLENLKK